MLSHAEIIRLLENDPANYGPGEPFSDVRHGPYGDCEDCPCDKSEPGE
jgi:hypothetical protein